MKITHAEFLASIVGLDQGPRTQFPEIAFAGRSNVGKSSLINCLLNRKNLAKTSGTPGKTRQLNYFTVNQMIYFVDLPGYGFAKVPRAERERWQQLIESYITARETLRGVVSIIDARHGPTVLDLELIEWLAHLRVNILIVATKMDKLRQAEVKRAENRITAAVESLPVSGPIFFSAKTGAGKKELLSTLDTFLE